MATYTTNLSTLNLCDAVTGWTEMAAPHATGSAPGSTTENYIHNGNAVDQATGQADNQDAGIEYDSGSAISWTATSNWVIIGWVIYASPTNLKNWSTGGVRIGIGSSQDNHYFYNAMGNDFGTYPYGGWQNTAIDPEFATPDQTVGSPTSSIQCVAILPNITTKITKGSPLAVDAWRYGRGDIVTTGTSATFTGMAAANDGTTARWGLFQYAGGTYLWKGLMSLGTSGASVTFSDSSKVIRIDDTPRVLSGFNKIEVTNASSSVTWTNINMIGVSASITGSAPISPGDFEMIDNATVVFTNCAFSDMGTFIFQSNATVDTCSFVGCGQITHNGADFDSCTFSGYEGTADTGYLTYNVNTDPDGEMDGCSFTKGTASTHAIEFGTTSPTTMTLRGIDFDGYNASNAQTDSTLHILRTSGTVTINLIGCSGNVSYKSAGATVNIVNNPVTLEILVKDISTGTEIVGARVLILAANGINFPYQDSITIVGSGTTATVTHTNHGSATNDNMYISGASPDVYNGAYQITVVDVNTYTYTTSETISTSPATGTIVATMALIHGTTNASGIISDSRVYSSDQDITGVIRKSTSSPYYQQSPISDTVDSSSGKSITVQMIEN